MGYIQAYLSNYIGLDKILERKLMNFSLSVNFNIWFGAQI